MPPKRSPRSASPAKSASSRRIAPRTGCSPFAKGAKAAGFKIIIAGAGGAAHLPGMTAR
jgi:phosphoribosylcarboxyaminoimidazole (NCAIR) mutase